MSDIFSGEIQEENSVPTDDMLITVYGWWCPVCEEASEETFAPEVVKVWQQRGLGKWIEGRNGWPIQLPSWLVKLGLICRYCGANTILVLSSENEDE